MYIDIDASNLVHELYPPGYQIPSLYTYNAEGSDYACSKLHWPLGASGVTWGHGLDFKHRRPNDVEQMFRICGIDNPSKVKIARDACGLEGISARAFCAAHRHLRLTVPEMHNLFNLCYRIIAFHTFRILRKTDVLKAYGETDIRNMNKYVLEIIIDMMFRGDFTSSFRRKGMTYIVENEPRRFLDLIGDPDTFSKNGTLFVPENRFRTRFKYLFSKLEEHVL